LRQRITNIRNKAKQHKTLIQNFSYLSALQVFNMLIPLITYPFLIRILGADTYGLVIFAQAIVGYLLILVGFGFNISATREISIHRDNKAKLNEIVSSVLIIKGLLFVLSCLILALLLLFIPKAHGYEALFILSLWTCLSDVMFPIWYFQGIEQMKFITYISLTSRLIFLCFIFVFIHTPADYLFVPIINGFGAIVAGCVALFLIFRKDKIRFAWQPYQTLKYYFKDSIPIFVSNVSISIYASTNKVIAGAFLGMTEVAYYDLAEKLASVLKIPQSILSQSLFPKISKEKNLGFIKRMFKLSVGLNIVLFVLMIAFAHYLIILLGGHQMLPATMAVNILAFSVPIIAMSNIFGIQLLIPFGYSKSFSRVIITSGLVYLILIAALWLTIGFSIISISVITVVTEVFVTSYMFYYCKKYRLWS